MTDTTNGLYFSFTANADYTNLLKDNIDMFAESLQYAVAIRILEDAVASVSDGVHNPTKDSAVGEWERLSRKYKGILFGGYISVHDSNPQNSSPEQLSPVRVSLQAYVK